MIDLTWFNLGIVYWVVTGLTALSTIVIAIWGLTYARKYQSPSPRSTRFLVWFGVALVVLGIIGSVGQAVFSIMGSYDGPRDELLRYVVLVTAGYLIGHLVWWCVLLVMVSRRRPQLKQALRRRF